MNTRLLLTEEQYTALRTGNIAYVKQWIANDPASVNRYYGAYTLLHYAARSNTVALVELLCKHGANINSPDEDGGEGPILQAVEFGANDVVRWLLAHGAIVNWKVGNETRVGTLALAVVDGSFELVKLLVENGADVNAASGSPPRNAIDFAVLYGQKQIANYLRSAGAATPTGAMSRGTPPVAADVLQEHITEQFGTPKPVSQQEVVPGDPPVSIHLIPSASKRRPVVFITTGMSDKPMAVPTGEEEHRFAEVFIELPADWPTAPKKLASAQYGWPLEWLRRIARYPHDHNTWLGGAATVIANGDPPTPVAEGVPFVAFLLLTSDDETDRLLTTDGRVIHFYRLFPLYPEEYQFERKQGVSALLSLFQKNKIGMTYDPNRKNVAKLKGK